jgi:hypothetical protein
MRPRQIPGPAAWLRRTLLFACLTAASFATAATVEYRHKDYVLLAPPPTLSELPSYTARVFDDQMAQARAITAAVGLDNYVCPLGSQDVARFSGNGSEGTLAVMGYRGCPFELGDVTSEVWLRLREPLTIDIDRIADGVMYAAAGTTVPFVAERKAQPYAVPTAVGVTWRFKSTGMRFSTRVGDFVTSRPGATLSFTGDGIRFTGFSSVPERAGVAPSTNGWSRDAMQAVQGQLAQRGYDPGPVDGLWGKRTRDALLAFQRKAGLEATGTLDSITLDELGI